MSLTDERKKIYYLKNNPPTVVQLVEENEKLKAQLATARKWLEEMLDLCTNSASQPLHDIAEIAERILQEMEGEKDG